ncbi:MAG: Bug family tripartite tricarboxylate transporter substrate binding protein [Burkholderiaceae bacterium]
MNPGRRAHLTAMTALMAGGVVPTARAQEFPSRPITLVSPFAAGGGGDALMRPLAKRLSEKLGQPVVVENRPGAGQTIGTAFVARSAPDGYTLLAHFLPTHVNAFATYPNLPYHPIKSFAPVGQYGTGGPQILLVSSSSKITSFQELVAAARSRSNFSYGSQGVGSTQNLVGEMLRTEAQLPWIHVPFQGGAPAMTALLGGHIDSLMTDASGIPHVQGGRVRAIGVSSVRRLRQLPDVPTYAELGFPNATLDIALCVFAPAGTPAPVVDRLGATLREIAQEADIREQFGKMNFEAVSGTPQDLQARMESDASKYWPLIERLGLAKGN